MDNNEFNEEIKNRMAAMKLSAIKYAAFLVAVTDSKEQIEMALCDIKSDKITKKLGDLIDASFKSKYRINSVLQYLEMLDKDIELFTESYLDACEKEQE